MTKIICPITPSEVVQEQLRDLPDAVIEVFNQLITQDYDEGDGAATVKQDDVVALLVTKGFERRDIFDRGWLNIEKVYRSAGWKVTFDKPGFSESYPATYEFKRPRTRRRT